MVRLRTGLPSALQEAAASGRRSSRTLSAEALERWEGHHVDAIFDSAAVQSGTKLELTDRGTGPGAGGEARSNEFFLLMHVNGTILQILAPAKASDAELTLLFQRVALGIETPLDPWTAANSQSVADEESSSFESLIPLHAVLIS
jgi:hypothetical protein